MTLLRNVWSEAHIPKTVPREVTQAGAQFRERGHIEVPERQSDSERVRVQRWRTELSSDGAKRVPSKGSLDVQGNLAEKGFLALAEDCTDK